MKFSIIINTHNQEKFINKAIRSSLNQTYKDFELIVVDTSDKRLKSKILTKYKKKVKYFHFESKSKYPEMNQMYKIFYAFKKSKGRYICLMDGDDFFKKNKLSFLNKLIIKKKVIFNQDNPSIIRNNKILKKKLNIKHYKKNFFFKKLINNWPQVYGTSSITIEKNILKKFFRKANPFDWHYLAIDIQLILFCYINYKIESCINQITFKNIHNNNLGVSYMNVFKAKFWKRRFMQHKFYNFLNKKTTLNLDYFISYFFNFFVKFL